MDKLSKIQRRRNMQAVRSTGSKVEVVLAKALWSRGLRYRKNDPTIFGRPDLAIHKLKIAIFVDGDFWHGRYIANPDKMPKSNSQFWQTKIQRNILRDVVVSEKLIADGWTVLRFWESSILKDLDSCLKQVEQNVNEKTAFRQN